MNAARLVKEFHKYFNDAVTSGWRIQILCDQYENRNKKRIALLTNLFDKMRFNTAADRVQVRDIIMQRERERSFQSAAGYRHQFVQPKSALVKVLVEPSQNG
jgi:hypothetical protein